MSHSKRNLRKSDLRKSTVQKLTLIAVTLILLASAGSAWACPVCYGDSDAPIFKGAQMSIIFLAITTYALIGGGVVMFVVLRRRARRLQKQSETA